MTKQMTIVVIGSLRVYILGVIGWAAMSENIPSDVHPGKIQISLHIGTVWSESLLGMFWIAKDENFLHVDNEDWSKLPRSMGWYESPSDAHVCRYIFSPYGSDGNIPYST